MNETKILKSLESEIDLLRQALDKIEPDWERQTLGQFADEKGLISESVCLPIRAAVNLLTRSEVDIKST